MRQLSWCVLLALSLLPQPLTAAHSSKAEHASAGPRMILIIRHGEKPEGGGKANRDPNLSERGRERAEALAHVVPENFVRPDYLFATHPSAHSDRPVETITPLAQSLHEKIDDSFKDEEVAALARRVLTDERYADRVVLICWHHEKIPELAHALGASDAPDQWSGRVFNRVWEISFHKGKAEFLNLPQKALPGD